MGEKEVHGENGDRLGSKIRRLVSYIARAKKEANKESFVREKEVHGVFVVRERERV